MAEYTLVYLAEFRRDLARTVTWSKEHFGLTAADRYGALIGKLYSTCFNIH